MFLTVEDETGAANVVVWVKVFEKSRRVLLSSAMLGVRGRIQREGEVVHLVSHQLADPSAELASLGNRETPFPVPHGRGGEAHHGAPGVDPRSLPKGRNIVDPYEHIDGLKVKTRDFR
ncbi:DNA-binding protein [Mesorhizobium sp. M0664]|uniref:DNA-binding protein n=1 Tax=Mesorhizobium sp. M0664 TaxID=2956982 RepID=UPI00333AC264